ncbi:NAD(P)-binding protein [Ceratobasidium sp. AG-I]|nr:NAD(P)-binding protein [Ceratobasidium sp. AG-I]
MTAIEYDLLVVGATGFTGRLVAEYLAGHTRAGELRVALGGRTLSKVQAVANKYPNFQAVYIDVSEEESIIAAVEKTRVVMNLAGPFWTHGSKVVRACASKGVHYVDLTGESPWLVKIIQDYDYLAHKTGSVIIPCSGYDSIPSDLAAHLAVEALEKRISEAGVPAPTEIKSVAAHRVKGGISGGTAATIFNMMEVVPREQRHVGSGWGLSPIPGPASFSPLPSILYSLPLIRPPIYGGFFLMAPLNEAVVRRSWGLRERFRLTHSSSKSPSPIFSYNEFLRTPSRLMGIALSLTFFVAAAALALLPPVRWLAKKLLPKAGEGPSLDVLDGGWFEALNVAEGAGLGVKCEIKGQGDPGYRATSVMVSESALLLLDRENLTELGKEGGILTPSTAFGGRLAEALEATGRFTVRIENVDGEDKKTR